MRKLIYISLIVLAGCETSLTPQQPTGGGAPLNLADYFWHDSTYHYQSSTGSQVLQVQAGGIINDQYGVGNSTLTFTVSNGAYSLSGFSPSDIFGFDSSLRIVADTTPPGPQTEAIRSIATATLGFNPQAKLYAVSDSVLYTVDPNNAMLDRFASFPKNFTLVESPQGNALFAYQMGGDSAMWTTDAINWSGVTAPASISAFASATTNFSFDIGWFACGTDVYRITYGSAPQKITTFPSKVITLTGENNGVVVGLDNGFLYDVNRNGLPQQRQAMAPGLTGIALVTTGNNNNTNPVLAGTLSGVLVIPNSGSSIQRDSGTVSVIFSTGSSIFASVGADSIFHYNADGTRYGAYANPPGNRITQFARPTSTTPNSSAGVFVLSGTSIFRRDSAGVATWTPINQSISAPPPFQPGSLTLLDSNSTWNAGFVQRNVGSGLQHSYYVYEALSSGPQPSVQINGTMYNNVIIVNFTAKANGVTDTTDVPEYNIYFEKNVGPAVIEKIENGKTVWTSLVK
jgi:hypothetical protein